VIESINEERFNMKKICVFVIVLGLSIPLVGKVHGEREIPGKIPETQEAIAKAKDIYFERCSFCHGVKGDGDSPIAPYLYPRARDFTTGVYKFRTTESGELPTDEDLFRIITNGVPGTSMPSWETLSEAERWQLVYYIKSFNKDFTDPEFDPYKYIVRVGEEKKPTPESIARGKEVYKKVECWKCHGDEGRGDGPSALKLKDDLRNRIWPFDLTKGWMYKNGHSVRDIYMTFTTGLNGTPMPSYVDTIKEEDRWNLAHYISSLIEEEKEETEVVFVSKPVDKELPLDPDDPIWGEADPLTVPLSGQVITPPRWQIPSVESVAIRSLYNFKEIGFLLEWNDKSMDVKHEEKSISEVEKIDTYKKLDLSIEGKMEVLRDQLNLQFPVKIPEGPQKPHFFLGSPGSPVNIWQWKADFRFTQENRSPVQELNARGFKSPLTQQPSGSQSVRGMGKWEGGRWKLVLIRSMTTDDPVMDIQVEPGKLIPIALHVWDGSNGERELMMAISSWYYLLLDSPTPMKAYIFPIIGMIIGFGLEIWAVKKVRRNSSPPG
jgi:DMSO reductase family type II enzyme heme b subunit